MRQDRLWKMNLFCLGLLALAVEIWFTLTFRRFGRLVSAKAYLKGILLVLAGNAGCRRARVALSFDAYVRAVDDSIDGDRKTAIPIDIYLDHHDRLVRTIVERIPCEKSLAEDVCLIYAVRYAERIGMDIRQDGLSVWNHYFPDAKRKLAGVVCPDSAIAQNVMGLNRLAAQISLRIVGYAPAVVQEIDGLVTVLMASDTVMDLASDIAHGTIDIPEADIQLYGIDLSLLMRARTQNDLHDVPGYEAWLEAKRVMLDHYLATDYEKDCRLLSESVPRLTAVAVAPRLLGRMAKYRRFMKRADQIRQERLCCEAVSA